MKTDIFLKAKKQKQWCAKRITCFMLAITAASNGLGGSTLKSSSSINFSAMPELVIKKIASHLNFNDTNALRRTSVRLAEILAPLQANRLIARYRQMLPSLANYDNRKCYINCEKNKHYGNNNVDLRKIIPPYAYALRLAPYAQKNPVQNNSADDESSCFNKSFSIIEALKKKASHNSNKQLWKKTSQSKVQIMWIPLRFYCYNRQLAPTCEHTIEVKVKNLFQLSNGKCLFYNNYSADGKIYGYIHDLEHPETIKENNNSFLLTNSEHLTGFFLALADGRLLMQDNHLKKMIIFSQDPLDTKNNSFTVLSKNTRYSHIVQLDDGRLLAAPYNTDRTDDLASLELKCLDLDQPENNTTMTIVENDTDQVFGAAIKVRCLMKLSNGRVLIGSDYGIMIKDINQPENHHIYSLPWEEPAPSLVIEMDNGQLLVTHGKTLKVWDITNPKNWHCITELEGHTRDILTIIQMPNGRLISADDYYMKIWDLSQPKDKRCVKTINEPKRFEIIKLLADGRVLSTAAEDNKIKIWDPDLPKDKDDKVFPIVLDNNLHFFSVMQLRDSRLAVGHYHLLKIWNLYGLAPKSE